MDKMKQLALDVKKLEAKLAVCTRCGVCQASCPLFARTRKEADVSRGKLALIKGLIDGLFDNAKGVNERLQRCLLCGSCAHGCPSAVNVLEIFFSARSIIAKYLGLPFGQKMLFKKLLANPEAFNTVMDMAAVFQPLFFKARDNVQKTSCARIASPLLRHRNILPLKKKAFHTQLSNLDFRPSKKGVRVGFFVGCLIDKALPGIAFSVVEVLNHFNAQVFVPHGQGCCGIPALASGDMHTFETLVETNVNLFSSQKIDYLVTACATCSSTIIKLWPALLKDKNKPLLKKIEALSEKTVDISWLMARRFNLSSAVLGNDEKKQLVTVHDPCHLKKSLDISIEPRTVIQAAGYDIAEMENADTCCGMGGSFNLKHYGLSSEIGLEKAKHIIDTKASIVATSCPACMMQLSDMLARLNANVTVRHPVELYARALREKYPD